MDFSGITCILIFGVTYWELTPWCKVIPHPVPVNNTSNTRISASSVLESIFEGFRTDQVQLPTNMETRRHEYVCNTLNLRTVAELKTISGRDMYLIHLLSVSDNLNEMLGGFRIGHVKLFQ